MREGTQWSSEVIRGPSAWMRTEMPRCTTRLLQSGGHAHAALHSYTGIPGWTRNRPCLSYLTRRVLTDHQGGTHWPSRGPQRPSTAINANQGGASTAIREPSKAIKGAINGHQRQSGGHQRPSGGHQRQSRGPSTAIKRNRGQSTYTMPPDCTSCSRQQPHRVSFEQQPGPESAHPTRKSAAISSSTPSPATDECR